MNSIKYIHIIEKIILITTFGLILITLLTNLVNPETFSYLIQEDGWIENWTAVILGMAGLTVLSYLFTYSKNYSSLAKIIVLLTALGLIFACGEEISWGQRFLEIESNEYFSEKNLQRETNIHNLEINGIKLNTVVFTYGLSVIFGIYFLIFRLLYNNQSGYQKLIDYLKIPIPYYEQVGVFLILTLCILLVNDDKKWELWECLFAISMYWIIISPYNNIYKKLA